MGEMVFLCQGVKLGKVEFQLQFLNQGLKSLNGNSVIQGAFRTGWGLGGEGNDHLGFRRPVQQGNEFMQLGNNQGQGGQS